MKKFFLFIIFIVVTCSCSVSYFFGDVKLMNDEGNIIKSWDSAMIEKHSSDIIYGTKVNYSAAKANGGLNFFNEDGEPIYIRGGIIMIDNITEERNNKVINSDKIIKDMKEEYASNKKAIAQYKEELKNIDKKTDSATFELKKSQIKALEDINKKLYNKALDEYHLYLN